MVQKSFEDGDIVFAKVKGYQPWPAKIIAVGKGRCPVLFFGTNESATCKLQDIFLFNEFKEKYGKNSKPAFVKAMREAEQALDAGGDGQADTSNARLRTSRRNSAAASKLQSDHDSEAEEIVEPKRKLKTSDRKDSKSKHTKDTKLKRSKKAASESEDEDDITSPGKLASEDSDGGSDQEPLAVNIASKKKAAATSGSKRGRAADPQPSAKKTTAVSMAARKRGRAAAVSYKEVSSDSEEEEKEEDTNKSAVGSSDSAQSSESSNRSSSSSDSEAVEEKSSERPEKNEQSEVSDEKAAATAAATAAVKPEGGGRMSAEPTIQLTRLPEVSDTEAMETGNQPSDAPKPAVCTGSGKEGEDNSSAEDDDIVVHSSRAHKNHSWHTLLSESDSDTQQSSLAAKEEEKDLEQLLEERKKEHQELRLKRKKEKMEERRQRQLQKQKEIEEEKRIKEEKKRQAQLKLKTERQIREIDDIIKRSLAVQTKDISQCLEAMHSLDQLDISAAMLVKWPAIIDTLKKCRKYKSDKDVMTKASELCVKLKSIATSDRDAMSALTKQMATKSHRKSTISTTSSGVPDGAADDDISRLSLLTADSTTDSISAVITSTTTTTQLTENTSAAVPPAAIEDDSQAANQAPPSADVQSVIAEITTTKQLQLTQSSVTGDSSAVSMHIENISQQSQQTTVLASSETKTVTEVLDSIQSSSAGADTTAPTYHISSVSDLKAISMEGLPSEDLLQAHLQALIAQRQEDNKILEQALKLRKEKKHSSSQSRKKRRLEPHRALAGSSATSQFDQYQADLNAIHDLKRSATTAAATGSDQSPSKKERRSVSKTIGSVSGGDDFDIDHLLGI